MIDTASKRSNLIRIELREDFRADRPLRVDREKGVIYGVKLLGRSSPNTHGIAGVIGTDYTQEAMEKALPLYEAAASFTGHPKDKSAPIGSRDPSEVWAWIEEARVEPEGIFGNLHYLKSHPMGERAAEAAEKNPRLFAMSHNALGDGEIRNRRYLIRDIPEVRSVDLVFRGGTTKSLLENDQGNRMDTNIEKQPVAKKFREIVAGLKKTETRTILTPLLEMEGLGDMAVADAYADEGAGNWKEHLCAMLTAIVSDESMTPEEIKKKVQAALKLLEQGEKSSDDGGGEEKPKEEKKETQESLAAEIARYRAEKNVRVLCESLEFTPTELQTSALVGLVSDEQRKTLIAQFKAMAGGKMGGGGERVRSQGLLESLGAGAGGKKQGANGTPAAGDPVKEIAFLRG